MKDQHINTSLHATQCEGNLIRISQRDLLTVAKRIVENDLD